MLQGDAHCTHHTPGDALRGTPGFLFILCNPSCSVPVPRVGAPSSAAHPCLDGKSNLAPPECLVGGGSCISTKNGNIQHLNLKNIISAVRDEPPFPPKPLSEALSHALQFPPLPVK